MDKSFKTYPAILQPDDKGLVITFPDFPGCKAHVESFDWAEDEAKKALLECIVAKREKGDYIPDPMAPQALTLKANQIPLFVPVIIEEYDRGPLPKWSQISS